MRDHRLSGGRVRRTTWGGGHLHRQFVHGTPGRPSRAMAGRKVQKASGLRIFPTRPKKGGVMSVINLGAWFGWKGSADTDLKFSEFFGADHTVMTRFMAQYPIAF